MNIEDVLMKAAQLNYNALLTGSHGVGKTHMVKEIFNKIYGEMNVHWRYFSASTLDPWVDFIGIPKNYVRESDGREVFGIIPPENFTGEENIQAIFFDEINRADPKTLNAIMELIQFRSINGRKFPNLKVIWAARNPDDANYSVEDMDDAQVDRFPVRVTIPNKLNIPYFETKYGSTITRIANHWWTDQVVRKTNISPRKMDDILQAHKDGFPIEYIVENSISTRRLAHKLDNLHEIESIFSIVDEGKEAIVAYFTIDKITSSKTFIDLDIINSIYKHLDIEECNLLSEHIKKNHHYEFEQYQAGNGNFTTAISLSHEITTHINKIEKEKQDEQDRKHFHEVQRIKQAQRAKYERELELRKAIEENDEVLESNIKAKKEPEKINLEKEVANGHKKRGFLKTLFLSE